MPLFRVTGRFADNFTFSVNPVDGADAREALGAVIHSPEIRDYGQPVVMVTVKSLSGSAKRVRISEKPAAERKGGRKKKQQADVAPAAAPVAPAATKRK